MDAHLLYVHVTFVATKFEIENINVRYTIRSGDFTINFRKRKLMGRKNKHIKNRRILSGSLKSDSYNGLREGYSLLYNEYAVELLGIISKDSDIGKLNAEIWNLRHSYIQLFNDFFEYALQQDLDKTSKEGLSELKELSCDSKYLNMMASHGLSIIDIEKYLLTLFGISITIEDELMHIFGNEVIKCYENINVISFKDNLSQRASDDIVCMNFALLFVYDFYNPNNKIHGIPLCCSDIQEKLIHEIEKSNGNVKDYFKAITICYEAFSNIPSFYMYISDELMLLCYALKFSSTDNIQSNLYTIIRIIEKMRSAKRHNDKKSENESKAKIDGESLSFSKKAKKIKDECKRCSDNLIELYIERIRNLDLSCYELSADEQKISNSTFEAVRIIRGLYDQQQDYNSFYQHITFVLLSMPNTTFLEISAQLLLYLKNTGRRYYASIRNMFNCNRTEFKESLVKQRSEQEFIEALDDCEDVNLIVAIAERFAKLQFDLDDWIFFDELIYESIHNIDWFITMYEIVNRLYIHEGKES